MAEPLDALMPHRPPMRWIKALTRCSETEAVAEAIFNAEDFPVADGAALETALVECAAQTFAAAQGQRMRTAGRENQPGQAGGMLAAVTDFKIHERPLCGRKLVIETREIKRLGPMLLVAASITCEGRVIASGQLSLYA